MARLPQQHAHGPGAVQAAPPPSRAGPRLALQIPASVSVSSSSSPASGAAPPFAHGGPGAGSQPLPPPGVYGQKRVEDAQPLAQEMRRLPPLKVGVPGRGPRMASTMSTGSSCSPASPASISTAPGARPGAGAGAGAGSPLLRHPASPEVSTPPSHTPRWGSLGRSMSFSNEDDADGGPTDNNFHEAGRSPGLGSGGGRAQHEMHHMQNPSGHSPSPSGSWASEWTGERSSGRKEERGEGEGEGGGEEGRDAGMEPHQGGGGGPHCSPHYVTGSDEDGSQLGGSPSMDNSECGLEGASPRGVRPRFTQEQCEALEKSFCENRNLDASRRASLAAQLGVQPRQVAIWFQNRRARLRYKLAGQQVQSMSSKFSEITERCSKLEQRYECLKQDHKRVLEQNANLRCQISELTAALSKLAEGACDVAPARRNAKRARPAAPAGAGASPGAAAGAAATGCAPGTPSGSSPASRASPGVPPPGSPGGPGTAPPSVGVEDTCGSSSSNCAPLPRKALGKALVGASPGEPKGSAEGTSAEDLSAPNTPARAPSSRLAFQPPSRAKGSHTTQGSGGVLSAPTGGPSASVSLSPSTGGRRPCAGAEGTPAPQSGDVERHAPGTPLGAPPVAGVKRKAAPSSGPMGPSTSGNNLRPPLCVPAGSPRPAANLLSLPTFARGSSGPASAYVPPPIRPGSEAASPLSLPIPSPAPASSSKPSPLPNPAPHHSPPSTLPQPQQQLPALPPPVHESQPPSAPARLVLPPGGPLPGAAAPPPNPAGAEAGAETTPPDASVEGTSTLSSSGMSPKTEGLLLPEVKGSSPPEGLHSSGAPAPSPGSALEVGLSGTCGTPDLTGSAPGLAAIEGELQLDDMLTQWDAAFGMPGSIPGSPSRDGSPGPDSSHLALAPFLPFLDVKASGHALGHPLGFVEGPLDSPSAADLGERSLSSGSSADGSSADPLALTASQNAFSDDSLVEDGGLGMQTFWWDMN